MIKDLFHTNRPTYSLEVFPPKKDADVSVIYDALDEFKTLHPSFISVTYGAGGNTAEKHHSRTHLVQNQGYHHTHQCQKHKYDFKGHIYESLFSYAWALL